MVEHAICNDKAVGDLDVQLAKELKKALTEHPEQKAALLSGERHWLAQRDAHCKGYAADLGKMDDCLRQEYARRLNAIGSPDDVTDSTDSSAGPVLSCDRGSVATIRPLAAALDGEDRCRLPDGDDILVRWGKPDADNSESEERFITRMSVWVNRVKWVDREIIDESGGGEETFVAPSALSVPSEIRISGEGMTKCYIPVYGPGSTQVPPPTRCSTSPRTELPNVRDTVEFPLNGKERPEEGSIRLVESKNKDLCSIALASTTDTDSLFLSREGIGSYEQNLAPQQLRWDHVLQFDIDNSGRAQLVVQHTESSHANMSDTYFVYTKEGLGRVARTAQYFDDLAANAEAIYPEVWEVCVDGTGNSHPPLRSMPCAADESLLMPFSMVNADKKTIRFRDQYMSMLPFRFEGATYFRLSTADTYASNVSFIVKPLPNRRAQMVCSTEVVDLYL